MQDTIKDIAPLRVVDEEFIERWHAGDVIQHACVFLEPHPELPSHLIAASEDAPFASKLSDVLGVRRSVAPFGLQKFLERADQEDYQVWIFPEALKIFHWIESLDKQPPIVLNSNIENSVNGLLQFQVQGFNMLKDLPYGVLQWDTGTGKTVGAVAVNKYLDLKSAYDYCIWVVKAHNKINTRRAIERLTILPTVTILGDKEKRQQLFKEAQEVREILGTTVVIINYETFRFDLEELCELIDDNRITFIWDEMPAKLKNRGTALYRKVTEALYTSKYPTKGKERTSEVRHFMLTADGIENSPEDWFNCMRMIDPELYGTVSNFNTTYIRYRDQWGNVPPNGWQHLDYMGAKAARFTHQVDKTDPDIAVQFPKKLYTPLYLELSTQHQKLYDTLLAEYEYLLDDESDSILDFTEILSAIGVFQMICDNPRMILNSSDDAKVAAKLRALIGNDSKFTDVDMKGNLICSKLIALKDKLEETEGQCLIFNTYATLGIPILEEWLGKWGYNTLKYVGSMSPKQKQDAEDLFKRDPKIKCMLLSDAGSDSLNFQNCNRVLHYNQSWTWTRKHQKQDRVDRIDSTQPTVEFIDLLVEGTVEDRKVELQEIKKSLREKVFKGAVSEQSEMLRNKDDLLYLLLGKRKGQG